MPTVTYTIKYPRSSESKRERENEREHTQQLQLHFMPAATSGPKSARIHMQTGEREKESAPQH